MENERDGYIYTVRSLLEAISRGDIKKAMALYESNAKILMDCGKILNGENVIKASLERLMSFSSGIEIESKDLEIGRTSRSIRRRIAKAV